MYKCDIHKWTTPRLREQFKMNSSPPFCIFFLLVNLACMKICLADPDNLQDLCPTSPEKQTIFINGFPCKDPATVNASDFKNSKMGEQGDTDKFFGSSVNIVTAAEFLGLNTLSLSVARTDLAVDGLVAPHSHPRASEIFFLSKGRVFVGFIDTNNQLFQKVLSPGDVFVFPRGLLHFSLNNGFDLATGFSVFNSQNPGKVSINGAMFQPNIEMIDKLKKTIISLSKIEANRFKNLTLPWF
ncbi:germin-like protein subfamily 3 member 4 [Ziziphus jujuba]|uniref:Germin-like protein n=2 Tax=Ziziphus jujuba TaxID=326968 RepID=A0A6P3ZXW1_ZIZJJ|nr:germin-like protein subfamily 3 member 4 [Ziziphus jujuba]